MVAEGKKKGLEINEQFPKQLRVRKRSEFQIIFKQGKPVRSKLFKAVVLKTANTYPRLGVAISKRIFKKAVDRNRTKRIVRETFRKLKAKLQLAGLDIVVIAKKQGDKNEQREDLTYLFKKIETEFSSSSNSSTTAHN